VGTLYLVSTPIGNLEDVTLRALRILREVSLVAAEDTRTTRKLLSHHGISAKLLSYNEHSMWARTPQLLSALAAGDVAFASEAGTPGVSDPGYELTRAAIEAGHDVVAVPGASALLTALAASGLPMREFTFLGFLPRRAGERRRLLASLEQDTRTIVFFESPHRVLKTLADVRDTLGDRRVAVCRELTKRYEEIFRGTVSGALERFTEPRGEFTTVVEGATVGAQGVAPSGPETLAVARAQLERMRRDGVKAREAVRTVTDGTGLPHREVYAMWLEISRKRA
jgi:16S rRNA (cytidine1402-2'-O)-methyltransferase